MRRPRLRRPRPLPNLLPPNRVKAATKIVKEVCRVSDALELEEDLWAAMWAVERERLQRSTPAQRKAAHQIIATIRDAWPRLPLHWQVKLPTKELLEQCRKLANSKLAHDAVKEPEKYVAAYLAAKILKKYGGDVDTSVMWTSMRRRSAFLRLAAALYGNVEAVLYIQCVATKQALDAGIEEEEIPPGLG